MEWSGHDESPIKSALSVSGGSSSSSVNGHRPQSWSLLSFLVHAGHFVVSRVHRTLTWTTGSLTCVSIYTRGTSVYSLIRRTFVESAQNLTPESPQG